MSDDTTPPPAVPGYEGLRDDILDLLVAARRQAARRVNALMTATYWEIGRRIVDVELGGAERAGYGDVLVERLADDLGGRFGRGFSRSNLFQMRAFYVAWPADRIVQTVSGRSSLDAGDLSTDRLAEAFPLPWSAYVLLLRVKSDAARGFYETEALRGGWSVRQLRRQIDSQFHERTALSSNKADYDDDGGGKAPRYYQVKAVNAATEAIATGQDRVLLVMATGTGKQPPSGKRSGRSRPGAGCWRAPGAATASTVTRRCPVP